MNNSVVSVSESSRPKDLANKSRKADIFAVFDRGSVETKQNLVGLVTQADTHNFPELSFADLINAPVPTPVLVDTTLDEVLKQLSISDRMIIPVCDNSGAVVGAITWRIICAYLFRIAEEQLGTLKHLNEELDSRTQQLDAVLDAIVVFLAKREWSAAANIIAGAARGQTASEYSFIGTVEEGPILKIHAHQGVDWKKMRKGDCRGMELLAYRDLGTFEYQDFTNIFGALITQGRAIRSSNLQQECESDSPLFGHHEGHRFLGVPIMNESQAIGCLAVANPPGHYTEANEATLEILANVASVLLESDRRDTGQKTLQEQMRHSARMEALGRLVGGISHDFNNLLMVITGHCLLARRRLDDPEALLRSIGEIQRAGERSAGLTKQLLNFSRRQVLEAKIVDLNVIVKDMLPMLHRIIGEDIDLCQVLALDLGRIRTDPGRLEQVVMNLIVNARDAMPNGGTIVVETLNVELDEAYSNHHAVVRPGSYVMMAVTDEGTGMEEKVRARVFEPYFTTKEVEKGTGLGLSTVYGIVKQSGGYIWVYSEVGRGTSIKVYLPRVEGPTDTTALANTKSDATQAGTETVLLVEDDNSVRTMAREILEANGYKVPEASNGHEALRICEEMDDFIDILITDVVMPKMNGHDLATRASAIRPNIKVIYMSGYPGGAIYRHGVLDVGEAYLQKPFNMTSLLNKVREVLKA